MDFSFTDEQLAIQDTARRFARERLMPAYAKQEAEGRFDRKAVRAMGELGLIAPDLPEAFGGYGLDGVSCGVIMEEIAYGDFNMAYVQLLTSLSGGVVCRFGQEAVAKELTPKLVAGEVLIGLALTEPRGGSDSANLRIKAERKGNGSYLLNGEKTSISCADQADYMVLFARTGTTEEGARGVSAFLLPMDLPGITTTRFDDLGSASVGRGSIFCENVELPVEYLLGDEGGGFRQVMQGFDYSRALIGLQCLAAARASLDETWPHVVEREAFGRPLAQYQGVTFPLAEGEAQYLAARLVCYQCLWLRDRGQKHTAEAAMAKWLAPKNSVEIIHNCLLANGHAGYSRDLPHQQRLRDVIGLEIGDGTAQIMKLIIAREKVGRVAVQYAS